VTKTIYLLDIDNFAPEVKALTLPFIRHYAERIGANIRTITERKFPDWPVTYEKLQIYSLAKESPSDWQIYVDLDALIHPECPDFTIYLPKGTVSFHTADISHIRFRNDNYSLRDGRYLAPGNWFMIASDLCLDLWRPLDMSPEEVIANIFPTPNEVKHGITREHLVDDYALSRNIARFGLAFKSFEDIYKLCPQTPIEGTTPDGQKGISKEFLFHTYTATVGEKVEAITKRITEWQVGHMLTR